MSLTINPRRAQAGSPRTVTMTGGSPTRPSQPDPRARAPAAIAGGTIGTITRLARGATIARRPKVSRTIGSVAASAAIEIARLSANQPGRARPRTDRRRLVSGPDQAINPAVASPDRAKPGSATVAGSIRR